MQTKFIYYLTSFLAGYLIMSLELLGFRLLAPYFGYSVYVFGSLIGLIMLALASGYFLGGYWADKQIATAKFFKIFLISSLYLAGVSFSHAFILKSLAGLSIIGGASAASLILFFVPMAFWASLSPFLLKVISVGESGKVGLSAGLIFAVSALGSLLGTFLTAFYLIPALGVKATLFSIAVLNLVLPLPFLVRANKLHLFWVAILIPAWFGVPKIMDAKIIYKGDSAYNHLEVVDYGNFLGLRLERRSPVIYSFYSAVGPTANFLLYDLFGIGPMLNGAKKVLLLGLGAGSMSRIHQLASPDLKVIGVEIDPAVVDLGYQYFGLRNVNNLTPIIADARPFLARNRDFFDVVEIDLFRGGGEMPFYLATQEFFKSVKGHLSSRGLLAMNVYDLSDNKIILTPVINTLLSVYQKAYYIQAGTGSYYVLATDWDLTGALSKLKPVRKDFQNTASYARDHIKEVFFDAKENIFTDDRTSLEELTYKANFKY